MIHNEAWLSAREGSLLYCELVTCSLVEVVWTVAPGFKLGPQTCVQCTVYTDCMCRCGVIIEQRDPVITWPLTWQVWSQCCHNDMDNMKSWKYVHCKFSDYFSTFLLHTISSVNVKESSGSQAGPWHELQHCPWHGPRLCGITTVIGAWGVMACVSIGNP